MLHREYGLSVVDGKLLPPTFAYNRQRMVSWVTLWPWSVVWVLGRDVFLHGIEGLVNHFGHVYQRISAWVFRNVSV